MREVAVVYFVLPDGRIVLQRRTKDAPIAPGQLGFFGGHVEEDETPEQALSREIHEETSLDPKDLTIEPVKDYILKADKHFPVDRHTFLYKAPLNNADFAVFEGTQAEAYTIEELLARKDVAYGVGYMLKAVPGDK